MNNFPAQPVLDARRPPREYHTAMKLTREEYQRLSPADQADYLSQHGHAFEEPPPAAPQKTEELLRESYWHPREGRKLGLQMMATPGQEELGKKILKQSDNGAALCFITGLVLLFIFWALLSSS